MKPCTHQDVDRAEVGDYQPWMCRICWHWLNTPEKRQQWEALKADIPVIVVSEILKKRAQAKHAALTQPQAIAPAQPQPEPKLPNVIKRARNYLVDITKWTALGKPLVDDTTYQQRRAACDSCPKRNKSLDACSLCGCPLHPTVLGDKLRMATARCADEPPRWLATVEE